MGCVYAECNGAVGLKEEGERAEFPGSFLVSCTADENS